MPDMKLTHSFCSFLCTVNHQWQVNECPSVSPRAVTLIELQHVHKSCRNALNFLCCSFIWDSLEGQIHLPLLRPAWHLIVFRLSGADGGDTAETWQLCRLIPWWVEEGHMASQYSWRSFLSFPTGWTCLPDLLLLSSPVCVCVCVCTNVSIPNCFVCLTHSMHSWLSRHAALTTFIRVLNDKLTGSCCCCHVDNNWQWHRYTHTKNFKGLWALVQFWEAMPNLQHQSARLNVLFYLKPAPLSTATS